MKPCGMDLQFWAARNAPTWARTMLKYPPSPALSLHAAINFRAKAPLLLEAAARAKPGTSTRRVGHDAGNALSVLRMARKRGENLRFYMIEAAQKYKHVQPERANTYNRWLRRMEQR